MLLFGGSVSQISAATETAEQTFDLKALSEEEGPLANMATTLLAVVAEGVEASNIMVDVKRNLDFHLSNLDQGPSYRVPRLSLEPKVTLDPTKVTASLIVTSLRNRTFCMTFFCSSLPEAWLFSDVEKHPLGRIVHSVVEDTTQRRGGTQEYDAPQENDLDKAEEYVAKGGYSPDGLRRYLAFYKTLTGGQTNERCDRLTSVLAQWDRRANTLRLLVEDK